MSAGDPLEDAFRAELAAILTAASIPWELVNTDVEDPDASTSYIQIRFEGGNETPFARGGGISGDVFEEEGQVFIDFLIPQGDSNIDRGRYSRLVRRAFRSDHRFFNTSVESGSVQIEIVPVSPLGGGQGVDGGMNVQSIGLGYRIYNVG